jgi:formylglycine-generating enzyme required for sulfatase activity
MTNKKTKKVRGGSWLSQSERLRSACRRDGHPERRSDYFGFRVVCVLSPRASHLATKDFQS